MKRIISYDIEDNRRRSQVFKLLKNNGLWIQYSVFELDCEEKDWLIVEEKLSAILKDGDSLCIYTLCCSCLKKVQYSGQLRFRIEEDQKPIL
ncbi:CRISPR-associated endonuclease Cas2 [Hazenella sp. IB182353]|uniref:CRISPR-associated endonuclease Cas2 n=1 Tax=Polycladospora coralii TaxID=2771432 RepID=UPI00174691B3|nr:CRISPR-associated endonuclease Cas2 [Polycladospora coralii]